MLERHKPLKNAGKKIKDFPKDRNVVMWNKFVELPIFVNKVIFNCIKDILKLQLFISDEQLLVIIGKPEEWKHSICLYET